MLLKEQLNLALDALNCALNSLLSPKIVNDLIQLRIQELRGGGGIEGKSGNLKYWRPIFCEIFPQIRGKPLSHLGSATVNIWK